MRLLDEIQRLVPAKPEPARAAVQAVPGRAAANAPAVVNAETLGHLEELGSSLAFVERLIRVFLSDSTGILDRIEKVLAGRDYHEFRSLVHAMKGSSASIGTDRLTRTCTSLGNLSDAELRLQAPSLVRTLGEEVAAAHTHLERYLSERRKSAG
jgi:HPt (histidine-containing phosphotransfer) domain-containing protein